MSKNVEKLIEGLSMKDKVEKIYKADFDFFQYKFEKE